MHRIFTVCDVIYAILEQYLLLDHPGERPHSPLPYRALLRLACIRVFSEQALQELWRNAGLIPLDSLPEEDIFIKNSARVKTVLPILQADKRSAQLFDSLPHLAEFQPTRLFCAMGTLVPSDRSIIVSRYQKLMLPSLKSLVLHVEQGMPFPWLPLLTTIPSDLHLLAIAPIAPSNIPGRIDIPLGGEVSRTEFSSEDVVHFSEMLDRLNCLRRFEARYFTSEQAEIVLEKLMRQPKLATLIMNSPSKVSNSERLLAKPLYTGSEWRALETISIRNYPIELLKNVLRICTSTLISSISLQTRTPSADVSFNRLLLLVKSWAHSLRSFRFEGPIVESDISQVPFDAYIGIIWELRNLSSLTISSSFVMERLRPAHIVLISQHLFHLETVHFTSDYDPTGHLPSIVLRDLEPLAHLKLLTVLVVELDIQGSLAAANAIPYHLESQSSLRSLTLVGQLPLSLTYDLQTPTLRIFPNLTSFSARWNYK